jgi:AmiR/NasT family two-component response regulator
MGYEVIDKVDNAAVAVQRGEETRPDLVLVDLRLRGDRDGIRRPTNCANGWDNPSWFSRQHADEPGSNAPGDRPLGYILEPFEDRELRMAIEMALYKREGRS